MFLRSNDFRGKERVGMGRKRRKFGSRVAPTCFPPFLLSLEAIFALKNSLSVCFSFFRSEESSGLSDGTSLTSSTRFKIKIKIKNKGKYSVSFV